MNGMSAISIARGLPDDGHLLCCDVSEEWTAIARRYWERAGLQERIELVLAPAAETLAGRPADEHFDFAFIDADKPGYPTYYEQCLALLRPGGAIAIDNMFWGGSVADPERRDEVPALLRALTEKVLSDPRVDACHIPIGDGVLLARKR